MNNTEPRHESDTADKHKSNLGRRAVDDWARARMPVINPVTGNVAYLGSMPPNEKDTIFELLRENYPNGPMPFKEKEE